MNDRKRLYLIDGSSYIYRAYFAIRHLSNSKGMATNAVLGFTNMLLKVIRDDNPELLAVVFDSKGPTFRKELYPAYKANRAAMPDDLVPQIPYIKQVVEGFNLPALEAPGFEADDIIATLAKRFADSDVEVTVVSGDKDLLQLVTERVRMLDTMKDKLYGPEEVAERFVAADKVIEVQSLAGDSSDNIPGVPGVGEKTAVKLIREFGSLDNLLANLDQVKGKLQEKLREFADQARLSRQLVTLDCQVPVALSLADLERREPNRERLTELFGELDFHQLQQEFTALQQTSGEHYHGVTSRAELDQLLAELTDAEAFCFDTETTGLDPLRDELVGLSFAVEEGRAWYVPLAHHYLGVAEQLDRELVLACLRPLFENPAIAKIGQNLKFDLLVLHQAGISVRGLGFDPMIASYLARPEARSHGMDALASELLGYRTISFSEICGKGKNQISFAEVEIDKAIVYAAEDADITLQLAGRLDPLLRETGQERLFREVEMPLVGILADMEWTGVRIDTEFMRGLSRDLAGKLQELESAIYQLAGGAFNIGSPRQLGEILFERLQLPRGKKTKTGWSTDVEVLTRLAEDHEIAARLLDYRSLAKLKSTYTDSLPKLVHSKTGRIHTSYNQAVTATGRLSSSDPNLQNIPIRSEEGRKIRAGFIPAEGNLLLSADYSQVELRLLAHLAEEDALKESFRRGEDIHRRTASEVFGVFPELVSTEQRRQAKAINFGVIYGISAFGLARQLAIGRREAQDYIDQYFARYPNIRGFMDARIAEAREYKYVTTLLGRRCAIPEIDSKNGAVRGFAERNAINYPVQGSAADLIKVAMVKVQRRLEEERLAAKMVLQVHDELVFDVPEAELERVRELVRQEMEQAVEVDVPLVVDIGVGHNWMEAH